MNSSITAIFIAALSFSFYPLLNAVALDLVSPYLLAFLVQLITAGLSFILLVLNLKSFKNAINIILLFWKLPWDLKIIPFLSGTGIFAGGLFFVLSLNLMTKTGATLIMECWPLLAIIVARALLTQKKWDSFRLSDTLLIILSLSGLLCITLSESGKSLLNLLNGQDKLFSDSDPSNLLGVLLAVLSAICFAWAGVSRSYFANQLPEKFRVHFFGKKETLAESNFTYMLTYFFGLPTAVLCYFLFDDANPKFSIETLPVLFLIGICLVLTSMYYSYALLIATNANINLLWYIAPVMATIWLIIFGYSILTPLIIIGGGLIILANLLLITLNRKKKAIPNERTNIN